ncbi:MAG: hypothetical protein JRI23_03365 [Deltaproteobacteria bacterium]|nr:hypothetical protein [Deltaproteobacteria bacterium]
MRARLTALLGAAATLTTLACTDEGTDPAATATTTSGAGGGSGGGSVGGAGGCPPGELHETDGTCLAAGIDPEHCAEGFEPDGQRGCRAILPADPCADGMMAIPGETTCREVSPCGSGTWGNIPVEANTEHVDQSYGGGGSDGSAAAPWRTLAAAIHAAQDGAIVALAAGGYADNLEVDKPVRIWGRCPTLVEIVGADPDLPTMLFVAGGAASELRDVAVRGGLVPVGVLGPAQLLVDRVRVHEGRWHGIEVASLTEPASLTLRRSLIDSNHGAGVIAGASAITIEETVIRDSLPNLSDQTRGRGIVAQHNADTMVPSELTLRRSLLDGNRYEGITVLASSATVESTVIRGTRPQESDGRVGIGLNVVDDFESLTGLRSELSLRTSVIESNLRSGLAVHGSVAAVEHTVIRDTAVNPAEEQFGGRGLLVQLDPDTGEPAEVTVRSSLIEASQESGVFVGGATVTLEATIVRDTQPTAQGGGRAVQVQDLDGSACSLTVRGSQLRGTSGVGMMLAGAVVATVEGVLFADTATLGQDGLFGDGLIAAALRSNSAELAVSWSRIEGSERVGLASFGSEVTIASSEFWCNTIDLNAEASNGLDPALDDLGGNHCACDGEVVPCRILSSGILPPPPLEEAPTE